MSALKLFHGCVKQINSVQFKYITSCTSNRSFLIRNTAILRKSSFHSLTLKNNTLLYRKLPLTACTRGFKVEVTDKVVDNIYIPTPVETFYELLEKLHDGYGIPWWLTIIASTVMLRTFFILPFAVLQQKVMAKIESTQIEINTYAEHLKQQTAVRAKESGWSQRQMADVYSEQISAFVKKVHKRENCRPFRMCYVSIAQVASWVTVTTAIGQMTGVYPSLFGTEVDIDFLPSLLTGGTLWFQDLVQSDFILPFLFGVSNVSLVLLWSLRRGPLTRIQHRLQYLLFSLSIGLVPTAMLMPSAITLYWTVSSLCGLVYFFLLRIPYVRRLLYIPLVPSEMKYPLKEMHQIFKIRFQSKKYF
ncbi:cytochrome c oxidase assembly protein COX18, mitochondrial-like [Antedon mediterranea]|uniref:cytochrome c oxidase assembly protein COX18, mitochondrial-like n=1 Tax=Antedon mediterranea TaxID=105859 RepID=UPI003AF6FA3C